jgi:uncharacterized protein YbcI
VHLADASAACSIDTRMTAIPLHHRLGGEVMDRALAARQYEVDGEADPRQPGRQRDLGPGSPVGQGGEINRLITRNIVGCYREHAGRGPTKAQAFYHGDVVVVVMREVLAGVERLIVERGSDVAVGFRQALNAAIREPLVACVEEVVRRKVVSVMTSTDVDADTAACIFILDGRVAELRAV